MEPSSKSTTVSQQEQWKVQDKVFQAYKFFSELPPSAQALMLEIQRETHLEYLSNGLRQLGPSFCVLDSSRPWICYWILHSMALLEYTMDYELELSVIDFLNRCQDANGGYGGGPGQMPHLATTYAAVSALITLGGHTALSSINRINLYQFLLRMKDSSGGFRMHENGEIDVRACYTAISVASVLNILDDELVENVEEYIIRCQTYEGGIAGEPGSEAHGGYTFCGLATMILINKSHLLDLTSLVDWVVFRQGVECGFQGRTNKLVDGCYSFWQGGVLTLLQDLLSQSIITSGSDIIGHPDQNNQVHPLFHPLALQQYLLLCSQVQDGGFRDKPGKSRDYYHTCYCLSGLSLCQYSGLSAKDGSSPPPPPPAAVLGPYTNLLAPLQPLYNVTVKSYSEAREYFSKKAIP